MNFKILKLVFLQFLISLIFNATCLAKNESEITIGLDVNIPPMGFMNSSGDIVGFDIDLAKEVFKGADKKIKFQPIDWDSKELELESGNIDVIWNGLSRTSEREKSMLLTRPYMKNRQVVITKKDNPVSILKDLKNKSIAVQKGSTGSDALSKHEIRKSLKEVFELENMVNCLNEVESGMSDATVVDEIIAKYYLTKQGLTNKFKVLDEEISSEYYVVAVKKGSEELKNQIEEQLSIMNSNGKASEISKKWFGENIFLWEEGITESTNVTNQSVNATPLFVKGLLNTLILFFAVIMISLPLGFLFCLIKQYGNKFIKALINVYINVMRGTPLLLQLLFLFYGLPYIPLIGNYISFKDRLLAGIFAFVINYAAYFAEIFRGGFLSIDKGQVEAAKVLGFSKIQTLYQILIPQLLKVTLPSICNETITLVKDTSLVYAIGVGELLSNTKNIVNTTANILPYVIAAVIYLVTCCLVTKLFRRLEKNISF